MGIHDFAPSMSTVFGDGGEPPFAHEWRHIVKPYRIMRHAQGVIPVAERKECFAFDRGVIGTDIMPRMYAVSAGCQKLSGYHSPGSWRSGGEGGGVRFCVDETPAARGEMGDAPPQRDSAMARLDTLVSMIMEPTVRLASMHKNVSVVFIADRPASGAIVRPPKDVTREIRSDNIKRDRARRNVTAPLAYPPQCYFDSARRMFVEVTPEGVEREPSDEIDITRLMISPDVCAKFYAFFAEMVRARGVFNDVHFDMPGCNDLGSAPVDPSRVVLPLGFAPCHAFSEGDNAMLYVARQCPRDAVFHAITADTDAVVMLACMLMLCPDNDGIWKSSDWWDSSGHQIKRRVYWHSITEHHDRVTHSKERVWAVHGVVDMFMAKRVSPHMLLATAILVGCDFMPHAHSLRNMSAARVWQSMINVASSKSIVSSARFNYPNDLQADTILRHVVSHIMCDYAGVSLRMCDATNEDIATVWADRDTTLRGRRLVTVLNTANTKRLFQNAWGYLFNDVLGHPLLQLDSSNRFMERVRDMAIAEVSF